MKMAAAIDFLQRQQQTDGSFFGYASASVRPFDPERRQTTIFPTALILECLNGVPGTERIRDRAAHFLQQEVTKQGSWNYWQCGSRARTDEPYPDDLDDTACSLAALTRAAPGWVDSGRLGQFAHLLVSVEQAPGGPYNTWLVDTQVAGQWQHVDVAVNANVGYALSLQSVCPSGLRRYIEQAIETSTYHSAYYVGELPVLYFLCRWYQGDQSAKLRAKIEALLDNHRLETALECALLISSARRLGVRGIRLERLKSQLQAEQLGDHWAADALYLDPAYDGQQHYGGSDALTTAFVLEALTLQNLTAAAKPEPHQDRRTVVPAYVQREARQIPDQALRRRYVKTARRVIEGPGGEQIYAAASLAARAGGWRVAAADLHRLDSAALNGWIAYTLYDDILDGSHDVGVINVANIALRMSYEQFIGGKQNDYTQYVRQVFTGIDCANEWELRSARAAVVGSNVKYSRLPDYGDHSQLAERSLGHSLAAIGVACRYHGTMDHPAIDGLQRFFKHFLIARQLNDDAHDWEADIRAGHLSAVVSRLLAGTGHDSNVNLIDDWEELRLHFWRHTLDEICALIKEHLQAAEDALQACGLADPSIMQRWLDDLMAATTAAKHGRDETLKFITAYEASHA